MKDTPRDYTRLTAIAKNCGFVPHTNIFGQIQPGLYTLEGLNAPIDLSACAEDVYSILRTAVRQLSELADENYHKGLENDLIK